MYLLDQRVSDRMPGGSAGKMVVVESTAIGGRADQTPVEGAAQSSSLSFELRECPTSAKMR